KIEKKPPVNETDVKEFIDRLVFVVEQPGEEELEHEVKELIRKMIRERMEIDDYDKIIEDVENKFKEWVESPNRKYWTQVDVIRVLNDATLQQLLESIKIDHIDRIKAENLVFTNLFPLLPSLSQFLS